MILRGSDICALPVICLEDSYKNMEVIDILYSNTAFKIVALLINQGKYFQDTKMIRFENIKNIGGDAITIQNERCIEEIDQNGYSYNLPYREEMVGLEVMTEDGNHVGIVQDVMIQVSTGKILGLILTESLFDDLIGGRPILPLEDSIAFNKDRAIISEDLNQSIIYNTGGLKKIFSLE